jgi:hypothetical protein
MNLQSQKKLRCLFFCAPSGLQRSEPTTFVGGREKKDVSHSSVEIILFWTGMMEL